MANVIEMAEAAPVLITVREAEQLCSLKKNQGYRYVPREWAPFVVRMGGLVRINRARLLEWANGNRAA